MILSLRWCVSCTYFHGSNFTSAFNICYMVSLVGYKKKRYYSHMVLFYLCNHNVGSQTVMIERTVWTWNIISLYPLKGTEFSVQRRWESSHWRHCFEFRLNYQLMCTVLVGLVWCKFLIDYTYMLNFSDIMLNVTDFQIVQLSCLIFRREAQYEI